MQVERSFSIGEKKKEKKEGLFFLPAQNTEKEKGSKGAVRATNNHTVSSISNIVMKLKKNKTGN